MDAVPVRTSTALAEADSIDWFNAIVRPSFHATHVVNVRCTRLEHFTAMTT